MGQVPSCGLCTMFAVATCSVCGKPLCGDHVRKFRGNVICEADLRLDKKSAADRKFGEAVAGYQRAMTAAVAWVAQANDPIERLVKIVRDAPRGYFVDLSASQREEFQAETAPMVDEARRVLFGGHPAAYIDLRPLECYQWLISSDRFAAWLFPRLPKSMLTTIRTSMLGAKRLALELDRGAYSYDPDHSGGYRVTCLLADGRYAICEGSHTRIFSLSPVRMIGVPGLVHETRFGLVEPCPAEINDLLRASRGRSL